MIPLLECLPANNYESEKCEQRQIPLGKASNEERKERNNISNSFFKTTNREAEFPQITSQNLIARAPP
jgi:hypothetical protein